MFKLSDHLFAISRMVVPAAVSGRFRARPRARPALSQDAVFRDFSEPRPPLFFDFRLRGPAGGVLLTRALTKGIEFLGGRDFSPAPRRGVFGG